MVTAHRRKSLNNFVTYEEKKQNDRYLALPTGAENNINRTYEQERIFKEYSSYKETSANNQNHEV